MSASIACPHCKGRAQVRSSRWITELYRQLYLVCRNVECGHTFGADITVTHTISPSACPDPSIELRQVSCRKPANDNRGPGVSPAVVAANDDDDLGEAVGIGI